MVWSTGLTAGDRETNGVHPSRSALARDVDRGNQGVVGSCWVEARGVVGLILATGVHGVEESLAEIELTMALGRAMMSALTALGSSRGSPGSVRSSKKLGALEACVAWEAS